MQSEEYKSVLTDGLPTEDGSYLVILDGETPHAQIAVRHTKEDGSHEWISVEKRAIEDDKILRYKRILITPEPKR